MTEAKKQDMAFIAKLGKVATDHEASLALIDREFDDASKRIGQSIAKLHGEYTSLVDADKREEEQEKKLRQKLEAVQRELAKIDQKIAKVNVEIAKVASEIQALKQKKTALELKITNRGFLVRLFYFFAEDVERQECGKLQETLEKLEKAGQAMEGNRLSYDHSRSQALSKQQSQQKAVDGIRQRRADNKAFAENAGAQARQQEVQRKDAENTRQARRQNLRQVTAAAWQKASADIKSIASHWCRQQPALVDLCGNDACSAEKIPEALVLGSQLVAFNELTCLVPHIMAFPCANAIFLQAGNDAQRGLEHHLLLRILQSMPPGRLEVSLVDPMNLGDSFAPFLPLLPVECLMPQHRVLTRADEIEQLLGKLTEETEDLIQHRFMGRIDNWSQFNAANPDLQLRYKVVLLFDVPEQLSDKSLWYLERLADNGPRCGILPIIAVDTQRIEDRRYEKLQTALKRSTVRIDELLGVGDNQGTLKFSYQPERWPEQAVLDEFLSKVARSHLEARQFNKSLQELWACCQKGATTIDGIDIPIGWTSGGDVVSLTLGATNSEHHALLAGKTGSGKSNLLHVVIHSLSEKYSPHELDLYLLDYKESTEFTVYANPELPHARLVATESDPEYGVTVLRHLLDELERRASLFKSANVRDFAEYRISQDQVLPRMLLIIDEFQVLFSEESQVSGLAEKLLAQLLKQGRSFGIHILLSTQTLRGLPLVSTPSLISQLGCRIALACNLEDSGVILGSNNSAAVELKSPPEGIINNANGQKSGNVKFIIPFAEKDFCRMHLRRLSEEAAAGGIGSKVRVFNGAHLPSRPALRDFQASCALGNALLLGERLSFAADAFSIPLDNRQSGNVLFSGFNDAIHDGFLVSILASMAAAGHFEDILYFNGRGIEPSGGYREMASELGARFMSFNDIGVLPLQEISDGIGRRRIALIIDGLDIEKALHPAQPFKLSRLGEPMTPVDLLKRIAEEGPRKGTFVFAFIDSWRRGAVLCKDLFTLFELRVAFCMSEDEAGALVSGGTNRLKGLEKPNRAVFVNRMKNETHWFRPYIGPSGGMYDS